MINEALSSGESDDFHKKSALTASVSVGYWKWTHSLSISRGGGGGVR